MAAIRCSATRHTILFCVWAILNTVRKEIPSEVPCMISANKSKLERNPVRSLKKKWHQLRNLSARVICFFWRLSRNHISETAQIHPCAYISSFKVKIGSNCVIGPQVVVYPNSILDDEVHLAAGCVIGSEGFVVRRGILIIHTGAAHIHRGARILSFSCVDKSTDRGCTEIGEGSRIDEQVHVAHDVKVGRRCHVESHVMFAGHVVTGDDVKISRNASISNRVVIGNSVRIGPGAVVTKTVQDGKSVSGNFAIDFAKHREFVKNAAEGKLGWLT